MENENLVPVYIMGKKYEVPASLTIQKAMEYAGYQLVRGCGCRGGVCGACGTVYRFPGSYKIEVGLACQTVVQPDMYLAQVPFFPANRAKYKLESLKPVVATLQKLYPETFRCVSCNTCTKSCPMEIETMDYINAAMRGDVEKVADLSFDCVMCGLCTSRCPAEIAHYNVAILMRRLYGKYVAPKSQHLEEQVKKVKDGFYDTCMNDIMGKSTDDLKKLYTDRDVEPDMAPEDWEPKKKDCE